MERPTPIYTFSHHAEPAKKLCDLGKATRRGIKKCPKCGTVNGTRGFVCKNKRCDAILKDCTDKRRVSLDAVRLVGIVRKVYSVKVRDRGPDYRGFVQLPLNINNGNKNTKEIVKDGSNGTSTRDALCFVDSCQRLFDDSILKCHETAGNEQTDGGNQSSLICPHIDSAVRTQTAATPIEFKQDLLKNLKVSDEIKGKLWILATEKEGPLVQRVSRTVMAVKCQVSPKHPLGYLHFTFGCTKGREVYDKYYCSCTEFMSLSNKSLNNVKFKCVHYYACICALASDLKCAGEFAQFISYEFPVEENLGQLKVREEENIMNMNKAKTKSFQISKTIRQCTMKKSVLYNKSKIKISINNPKSAKRSRKIKKIVPKLLPLIPIKNFSRTEKTLNIMERVPNIGPVWTFLDWMAYVTESINQTMQFGNFGLLNSLVFGIPLVFYEEFKNRMPQICRENPTFPDIYQVMNILDLKEIFDTCDVKLQISKRFVQNPLLNTYVEFDENDENVSNNSTFIYFLNVGQSTVDESDNTNNSFLIEWIPNIAHRAKVGQLKLQYKYGRKST